MNGLAFLNQINMTFPDPERALVDPNGLLAVGGDLQPQRLLTAYYNGIFPWFNQDDPILWWSPDPRAIFELDDVHISRSLRKTIKRRQFYVTINQDFEHVIRQCAAPRAKQAGTWITQDIINAYCQLHTLGRAHSIEVRHTSDDQLVGGLYGINVGQIFCGESMFHIQADASKIAFVALINHLKKYHYKLIDAQIDNPYLQSLGSKQLTRTEFLCRLRHKRDILLDKNCWLPQEIEIGI